MESVNTTIKKRKLIGYKDRIQDQSLLSLSEIRQIYKDYDHDKQEKFEKNLTLHDIGCVFYLIYLKRKYKCEISFTEKEIKEIPIEHQNILEWLEEMDYYVDDPMHPKFLIYYKNKEFIYDPNIIKKNCSSIQIHLISHTFPVGSGHIGALMIENNKCYYFDSNGLKDKDDCEYYDDFINKLILETKKYDIEFIPYHWKRGLQVYQETENERYKVDMIGMCCSWSFFMMELRLMNPKLTIGEIENKIKKKYRNRMTRMICTYQQEIHQILWKIVKEIYFSLCKNE
jgi:hypothetical protein